MSKKLKPRDKITQKMSRDGLIEVNETAGTAELVSGREQDADFSKKPEQAAQEAVQQLPHPSGGAAARPHTPELSPKRDDAAAERVLEHIDAAHTRAASKKAIKRAQQEAAAKTKTSRLQFTEEERATPELQKAIRKSERAADRLDEARAAIPKKKVLTKERTFDEAAGKGKTRLRFEEKEKPIPGGRQQHNPLSRPVQEVGVFVHNKIHSVVKDNSGVEGAHKSEELAERGIRAGARQMRKSRRSRKLKPYRAAEKAEHKAVNANAEYHYQKVLHDNPEMLSSNPLNRFFQKQRLKREYAKAARTAKAAGSTAQATAKGAEKTAEATATAAKKAAEKAKEAAEFVARHWKGVLVVLAGFLLIVMLIGGLQSCSALVGAAGGGVAASSYQSEDADILAAEAAYCALEAELQEYLDTYERTHDYDEYHYDLDEIKHDPYVLASILSALHDGAWTASEVRGTLQMLFEKQYILTETDVTEVRYRTVTRTDSEGNEYEVEVPYNYYICTVELENFDLSHLPVYIMDEETLSKYALYMSVLGNKPELFGDSEYIPKYITNRPEGYEIPPSAMEDETFAAVITEAEKYLGYPYVWGGSSPSTSFDCSGFVSWVLTNSGVCNTGRLGAQGLYNISTPVSNPQPGDLVFFVGTYDTPGVSHVGIYVGNSMMIHCGDPISYSNLNSSYWQAHFYAYARPPYN